MAGARAQVGLFGLGLIGMALARRLAAAGHAVTGYDPRPEQGRALEALGGRAGTSLEAWRAPLVLSAVYDTDQLAQVIAEAPEDTGAVLVSLSTCDPDRMCALADLAAAKAITLVEAPVSGTSKAVAEGTALLLLAGPAEGLDRFERIRPAISDNAVRVGDIGDGTRAKLAVNLVLGLNRAAIAEGLVFAKALGLDPARFLDVSRASAAYSAVMDGKGRAMVARDWTPLGRIEQTVKDFGLIREMAGRAGLTGLPFAETYLDLVTGSLNNGESDLDNSAILLAIERAAGARS